MTLVALLSRASAQWAAPGHPRPLLRPEAALVTASAVVSAAAADGLRDVEVVPLVGGLATDGSVMASQELVRELAARLGATYGCLHGPALLHSDPRGTRCLPNRRSEESSRGLGPPTSPWSRSARSTQNRLAAS